jgi:hypothetical protein
MSAWPAFVGDLSRRLDACFADVRERSSDRTDRLLHRASERAWSNLEIAEHVVLVNRYLLILADKIASKSRRRAGRGEASIGSAAIGAPPRLDALEKLASSAFEWHAPAHMIPTGALSSAEIDEQLRAQHAHCAELLASMPNGEGSLHRIRMSVVGGDDRLDLYQFLAVIALHMERHARAMRRNEASFAEREDQPR